MQVIKRPIAITDFEDFLKSQNRDHNQEQRKSDWLKGVSGVYEKIESWISKYKKEDLIQTNYASARIDESLIGQYETQKLTLIIGNKIIEIVPIGTYILGSYGRIDIRGSKGTYHLIQKEFGQWQLINNRSVKDYLDFTQEHLFKVIEHIL